MTVAPADDERDGAAKKEVPPPSYRSLAAPVASPVDKFALLPAFLKVRGLVKEHIDSFNYFITRAIRNIVYANNRIEARNDPNIYLRYTSVHVGTPSVQVDFKLENITPHFCRLTDRTYSAPVTVDIEYTVGRQHELKWKKDVLIGYMPIMLRSYACILHGKDEAELARLGECPLDPGGYFIVKGTEKVILIQEQLSKNRIIIDTDSKGRVIASVTSSTHEIKSKTVITLDKEKIYLQLNQFTKPIPIIVVMKAMGMESDQEVVQMVGRYPRYGDLLFPSIQECASERVYTQQKALQYMDEKVTYPGAGNQKEGRSKSILRDVFIAHVPDYVGNKRLELSGQLISLLFEDLFKTMNSQAVELMNKNSDKTRSSPSDFSQLIKHETITSGLERAISTGNWDIKRFRMHRKGVSQVLSRLSYMASLGYMTRITPQFEKTRKTSGPRALQPSQWGMLCPCDTPEGEACGLTKNLALLTHVTTDQEEGPLMNLCKSLGVEDLSLLSGEEIHAPGSFLVMFNGLILGKHRQPQTFANAMRELRRSGRIGEFVSIFVNEKQHCIHIASDGGRVCRPLIIADNGVSRVKERHMKELRDGIRSFDDFLRDGLIEYLDVNEENNALITLYEHVDQDDVERSNITHIEIEPLSILGVVSGLIPYPHHNQSPRNTYQCAMGKQAMGNIAYNQLFRADSLLYLLVYAQRPLLTTKTIELVGYDKLGAGQNATVAVMGYSGYDIEDAIVMNKSSLDRGFGRCIAMKKYTVTKEKHGDGVSDRIAKPQRDKDGALVKQNMRALDEDGVAAPGQIIRNHDVYVNKQVPNITNRRGAGAPLKDRDYKDSPAIYKGVDGETTVVDRVMLCSDTNDKLTIKCIIRHTRRPEVGDKFSSRHGQKGVCGTIVQQEDFPFSERGICPDLIMNPHGFPSRMTIGKMIELLGGKAGVSCGRFHYGSAFGEPSGNADKVEDISNTLIKHGFSYNGKDFLYSGVDGETTVVDRVMLCSDTNDKLTIKCIIRHTRRPEVGDKFSSRHGQKGVCGTIVQQEDFPFSERGICPDLIMNPHGFPSRMTIGKMIELLGGKAGVSCGRFHYGSAFGEPSGNADKVEDISNTLIKHGFSYNGKDFLYSGILGHPLEAYIFMGPIYYQKLKHMVLDKMHARASGPRVLLTRQPTEGRSRDGGLRLGEMERDCLIAYGASMLIFERLLLSSDPYQVQVCRKCGLLGYYNHKLKTSYCSMCKNGENMAKMRLPYACKLLFQELHAMNVVPRLKLTEG